MSIYVPVLLAAVIMPFILWPIEIVFPYPHIIEELAKATLVFFLLKSGSNMQKIIGAIALGLLFGLTENFLYLFSFGNSPITILRFMITTPLHITTTVFILLPALLDKRLLFIGIILAGYIHYFFNVYVATPIR